MAFKQGLLQICLAGESNLTEKWEMFGESIGFLNTIFYCSQMYYKEKNALERHALCY